MKNNLVILFAAILLSISTCSMGVSSIQRLKAAETDSLRDEISKYTTDTARFSILLNYFWKYANTDLERVKPVGEWAFNVIRNSSNLKSLSDGYDIKGFIFRDEENYDSSFYYFGKALMSAMEVGYTSRIAWSYYHLGELNYLFGDFTSALNYMRNSVKYFTLIGNFSGEAESIYYISDMYDRMGIRDSALLYNFRRLTLYKSHSDTIGEIVASLAISTFYKNHSDTRKSLDYLNNALRKAENMHNSQTIIKVYFTIGDFFAEQKKNYSIANDYYARVLEYAQKNNIKTLQAQLLNQIGNIYLLEDKDSLALQYNLQSLTIAKEVKHRHTTSNAFYSLGLVYKKLGDYPSALKCFNSCYTTGCNKCPAIAFHKTLLEIGDIYLILNDPEQSLTWYKKSFDLAEKFHSVRDISISALKIGNSYNKLNQPLTTEKYYLQSFKLAKEIEDAILIKSIADTLSSYYAAENNYSSAYMYKLLTTAMRDSLNEINAQTDMTELSIRFEFEKIQKENEAKQLISALEIKKQKNLRNYFVIISLLFIGVGFLTYSGYRRKKTANILLTDQKKQIEEKSQKIKVQVAEITSQKNEIERISGELHESDEMKLRFFSNISHEFRTPLTLILNPAENLLKTISTDGNTKKQLEYIYENAKRLQDLTNQIMDLQKLDAGKLQLNPELADIIDYCLGIASAFESLCQKKNIVITFYSNHRSVFMMFDKDKIGKIIINLLSNAVKFSDENSSIEIKLETSEHHFRFTIIDNGVGIAGEEIKNVFRRYYQVPSENKYTGTGIGLAYVKELVRFMKGEVSMESELKKGTKVTVSIPVDECHINDTSEYRIDIPMNGSKLNENDVDMTDMESEDLDNKTVLLIEDNRELRFFITFLLKPEFNVVQAKDGHDGLNAAYKHIPDLIISDVMMPGIDGYELCSILKNDERTSHIPVILLTARDDDEGSLKGYQTGADDYITKPFTNEHLKLKVRNIISTREAARNQFDFKSLLSQEGLKIGVTDKEFMRKCLSAIETHINDSEFSVEKLAGIMAFSNRNFYRKIKALTNLTPAELIRIYRLNYARQLLQTTKLKVFEISLAVGYEDTNKFRKAFKKQFGISPSESSSKIIA